jgi:hypothetical protein
MSPFTSQNLRKIESQAEGLLHKLGKCIGIRVE